MRRGLGLLLASACAIACAPNVSTATFNGVDVVVDADAGRITAKHGGATLLDVGVGDIGVRASDATYDMQFGMFDIEEAGGALRVGTKILLPSAEELRGGFSTVDDDGITVAQFNVAAVDGGAFELSVRALGAGNDDVVVTSACSFKHAIGLGAQTHDVDHFGQRVPLWVSEQGIGTTDDDVLPTLWQVLGRRHTSYAPIPAFVADNGAAYVVNDSSFARVDLCASDAKRASFEAWGGELHIDVYAGESPADAQQKMVDALGRPPAPPPWTFAPWNDAIFGSENVRSVAHQLRDAGIPSSVIWTEDWRGGRDVGNGLYRLDEDWGVDAALYPDFDAMVDDVNALGFEELVYFNSFVVTGADIFHDVVDNGRAIGGALFTGPDRDFSPTTLVDLTNDDARAFVKQHFADAFARGVRGWMADFGEWLPVADDTVLASGEDPRTAHNKYPVLWQQVNREAQEEAGLVNDSVVFVRSAHLGSQPLVQVVWAGDQRTSFQADDGLPTVIPIGLGLSTTGFPFVTHDIAGYQSATNDPVDTELFKRWTELGAFTPVMRTHHGTHPTNNVGIFTDAGTTAHWKRYATLHMRLYPYLRALALHASDGGDAGGDGLPLWIALPLLFPGDDDVWALKDELMLGPSLLVAPVVAQAATSRSIVFPSARFAPAALDDVVVGDVVDGPATKNVDVGVDDIAVYIVAGGIVPTTTTAVDTLMPGVGGLVGVEAIAGAERTVYVGLGASGTFVEEDGTTYTLEGAGTDGGDGADGANVTGNDVVSGDGFTFTVSGAPNERITHVVLR